MTSGAPAVLRRGDLVPHFDVQTLDGRRARYADVWQRRNLLLVRLDASRPDGRAYAAGVRARAPDCAVSDAECIATSDSVPGLGRFAALVADRWGEVVFVAHASSIADLPTADDLLEWLAHVQQRCPECEGEAR